jgi:single-strand DNA-binding protein
MNIITLIGRVGGDPDYRSFPTGGAVISFSLATSEKWTSKDGEKKEKTE